jgi:hypothetical protein
LKNLGEVIPKGSIFLGSVQLNTELTAKGRLVLLRVTGWFGYGPKAAGMASLLI